MTSCFKQLFCFFFACGTAVSVTSKPNIVVIIADDLGWNDVGFHGSDQIPTPNIDALAYNGIILNRHYVLPSCTPSRAALMTGKYPIRTGLQGDPGRAHAPWGLPLNEKILPQYLKDYGYKTHLVGKWHLGFHNTAYTPTKRGFDSHFGYYNGYLSYNDSTMKSHPFQGIDARRNLKTAGDEFYGKYVTDVFTGEAVSIIRNHDPTTALFLEVSHVAVHALKNNILQVRDEKKNDAEFGHIADRERRLFAGVLRALDDSVGEIVAALKEAKLLENSVVLFMSDNGGPTEDMKWRFRNTASNWPLRGLKTSLHEGGVRGAAAIWSPLFTRKNYVSNELFHICDWLPTFIFAAGGNSETIATIDGINQWNLLIGKQLKTDREEVLVNVDFEKHISAIIHKNWKLINNNETYETSYIDDYAGIAGRTENATHVFELVLNSTTNRLLRIDETTTSDELGEIRARAKLDSQCQSRISSTPNFNQIKCIGYCLFDLDTDPCEFSNVAETWPDIVTELNNRLKYYESLTVPQIRPAVDTNADPSRWNGYWSPWTDEISYSTSSTMVHDLLVFSVLFVVFKKIGILV